MQDLNKDRLDPSSTVRFLILCVTDIKVGELDRNWMNQNDIHIEKDAVLRKKTISEKCASCGQYLL